MTRLSWLASVIPGAMIGAMVLTSLTSVCQGQILDALMPNRAMFGCGTPFADNFYQESTFIYGISWSGGLFGAISTALFISCPPVLRLVGGITGAGISGLYLWHAAECFVSKTRFGMDNIMLARLGSYSPLVLWGLLLVFVCAVARNESSLLQSIQQLLDKLKPTPYETANSPTPNFDARIETNS